VGVFSGDNRLIFSPPPQLSFNSRNSSDAVQFLARSIRDALTVINTTPRIWRVLGITMIVSDLADDIKEASRLIRSYYSEHCSYPSKLCFPRLCHLFCVAVQWSAEGNTEFPLGESRMKFMKHKQQLDEAITSYTGTAPTVKSAPLTPSRPATATPRSVLGSIQSRIRSLASPRSHLSNILHDHPFVKSPHIGCRSPFSAILLNLASSSDLDIPMPLGNLCDQLRSGSLSPDSKIHKIIHRTEIGGLTHEYLLVEVELVADSVIWLRLERSAARHSTSDFSVSSFFSVFPSKDMVRLASDQNLLLGNQPSKVLTEVHFAHPEQVSLYVLCMLLSAFAEQSKNYSLSKENCWFFCSVVVEMLCEKFAHRMTGEFHHRSLGRKKRNAVRRDFNLLLASSTLSSR
jgi:hypothetical protein